MKRYLNERHTRLFLRKGFILVARPFDIILQTILLLGRRITQHQHLSAGARGRISKEVAKLGEQDGSKA